MIDNRLFQQPSSNDYLIDDQLVQRLKLCAFNFLHRFCVEFVLLGGARTLSKITFEYEQTQVPTLRIFNQTLPLHVKCLLLSAGCVRKKIRLVCIEQLVSQSARCEHVHSRVIKIRSKFSLSVRDGFWVT